MKEYSAERIRNLGFFGHASSGKTSLCEALLLAMKQNTRLGSVAEGTSLLDYDEDEVARKISINLSLGYGEWQDTLITLVDTPGYADFFGNVVSGVRAVDNGVVVVDASSGVEVGTEMVWRRLDDAKLPRTVFVNKLKKEHASFDSTAEDLRKAFGSRVTPVFLPIGKEEGLSGVVDLLNDKAYTYDNGARKEIPVPADMKDAIGQWKEKLVEVAAEVDEKLMEKFIEGGKITPEEMRAAVRKGIKAGVVYPLVCGDALAQIGVDVLLDLAVDDLPGPLDMSPRAATKLDSADALEIKPDENGPVCALVFKTVSEAHVGDMNLVRVFRGKLEAGMIVLNAKKERDEKVNQMYVVKGHERVEVNKLTTGMIGALVKLKETHTGDTLCDKHQPAKLPGVVFPRPSISVAIVPQSKGDEERVSTGLARLHEEDPTFSYEFNAEIGQQLINGMGELHLDVIVARLKRRFDVNVDLIKPRIPYRETITKKSEAQGRHKKQTGGRGQFGDCWLRLEPVPRGTGFEFVNAIRGGSIPTKFIPPIEKGIVEQMEKGVLAGYHMMDMRAVAFDGSYHDVDSSDIAFKLAGSLAFKNCCEKAGLVLLEPIMNVEVTVPDQYTGDVMGDLNARRGRIMGMEVQGNLQVVKAQAPMAEMYKYSNSLRSMTQGRGFFSMEFSHYEETPRDAAQKVIDEAAKAREAAQK
ncbi:MAG: elongation factor G [candidate division WOR-3 bacterium]|nr:elongation factor G [candidate division WOR-3 bacterium]